MKPNCCLSLTFTVKSVSILDFISASLSVLLTSGGLLYFHLFPKELETLIKSYSNSTNTNVNSTTVSSLVGVDLGEFVNLDKLWGDQGFVLSTWLIIGVVFSVQKLLLACIFVIGVFQERARLLRVWVVYTLVLIVLATLMFLALLFMGVLEPWSIPFYVGAFISREYVVWVGYTYLKRIQSYCSDHSFLIPVILGGVGSRGLESCKL